jgi:tape measure domain-containing protein
MADDKPIIDFGNAPRDLQLLIDRLKLADGVILKISQDALTAGRNLSNIQLPSDLANFTAENQRLTAQIQAQAQALFQLQNQYNTLSRQRQQSSQRTAEESVNQGILNRNALESARINSTLAGAYMRLSAQQSQASRNLQDLVVRGRLATQTQREYDRELRTAQRDFNTLNQRITSADQAVGRFNRNVGNYPMQAVRGLKDLLGAFGLVGGVTLAAGIFKDIFEKTKEIQSLNMALKQVTETNELFAQSQAFLSRISEAYGANINDLTKQFTQFYVSAKDKISGSEIEQIFESITKAGASMGLSTEQQEKAFLALNQMMSKGTIQAEELRGQLGEALPGSLGIMAKAVGVTEKKLAEMMKSGDLLASDVLPKFARQLEITYGVDNVKRIDNLATAQNRFSNAWISFVAGLDEDGNKLSSFFGKTMGVLTKILEGTTLLFESEEVTRKKSLDKFRQDGYNSTLNYYKSLDEIKKQDLINDKTYTQEKIDQETKEFNRLKGRNLILKAIMPEKSGVMNTLDYNAMIAGEEEIAQNKEKMKAINNLLASRIGNVKAVNELLNADKKAVAVTKELTKTELKAIEDHLKALYDASKKELELQIAKNDAVLNNEDNYYTDRLTALDKNNAIRLKIAKLDYNEHFRLSEGDKNKQRSAQIDFEIAKLSIAEKYTKERIALEKLQLKSIGIDKPKEDKTLEESSKKAIETLEQQQLAIAKTKEYMGELKKATNEWLGSFSSEFLQNSGFGSLETFFDGSFDKLLAGDQPVEEKFAVTFNAIAESAQEAFNFMSNASQANFDAEYSRLESQKEIQLKFAGDSASARAKIEEDAETKKKEIANRENKAKQKQAIFNIAIDTAQGIVSALASTPPNVPLSIAIGAIGALQIGLVASKKVPQYWKGTDNAPAGLAYTNERGAEIHTDRLGNIKDFGDNKGARLTMMEAGDKVYTAEQSKMLLFNDDLNYMLKSSGVSLNAKINQTNGMTAQEMDYVIGKHFAKIQTNHTSFDKNGIRQWSERNGNKTIINNAIGEGKGFRV